EQIIEEKKNKFLTSPFDDADERMDLLGLLQIHGYSIVGKESGGEVKIKRPGATSTHSGYYKSAENKYVNFSTSSEFEGQKVYSASAVFTILECGGDWKRSYKELLEKGYGHQIDMSPQLQEFTEAFKKGDLMKLLELHFGATKCRGG